MLENIIEESKKFAQQFALKKYGFYDITPYSNIFGFSVKKKLNDSGKTSLLKIYIPDAIFKDSNVIKKQFNISATYGVETYGGVEIRFFEDSKINDPVDAEFPNEYFYNIGTREIYRQNNKITTDQFINEVYNTHIKPTKRIAGILIRTKVIFWRIIVVWFFRIISFLFQILLFVVSGDRYSYDPII